MAITEDARDSYDRDGDTSPVEMEAPMGDFSSSRSGDPRAVEDVLYSDVRHSSSYGLVQNTNRSNRLGLMFF